MAHIILFHSALGLRPQVTAWKERLEEDGHVVHTPDLFDGEVFDTLEAGVAKRDALGIPELSRRALAAVESLPPDFVYAGFSMGAASAQFLAMTRPGARALVLMHGALAPAALGTTTWPEGLRAQVHVTEEDPWVSQSDVDTLAALSNGALEAFRYDGAAHLFADGADPDYVEDAAEAMFERVRAFVTTV